MPTLQDRAFPGHFDQRCPSFLIIEILIHQQSVQLGHLCSIHAATCLTQTLDHVKNGKAECGWCRQVHLLPPGTNLQLRLDQLTRRNSDSSKL